MEQVLQANGLLSGKILTEVTGNRVELSHFKILVLTSTVLCDDAVAPHGEMTHLIGAAAAGRHSGDDTTPHPIQRQLGH